MYVNSHNTFDKTNITNKQKLRMESFAKMTLFDTTATLTAMDFVKEHSIEHNHLSKLINDKINKATLSMKKEIDKLRGYQETTQELPQQLKNLERKP